jgi:3-isopropylmalate/(R)-2-methylmalate dehydratase large subunit
MSGETLFEKLWNSHLVAQLDDGVGLIYVDRHLVHEVSSPQAFKGLALKGRPMWRAHSVLATPDHNVPTHGRNLPIASRMSRLQLEALTTHVTQHHLDFLPLHDRRQGIVHVVGPEQGFTLPGLTLVCGDSHSATHGALGCLAFGIGTSEVEHVLATQTLQVKRPKTMRVRFNGLVQTGVSAKDLALALIGQIGVAGASGHAVEFCGEAISSLGMEGRMTLCNMSIEAGARTALMAVDELTIDYIRGRPRAPKAADWDQAVLSWRNLHSDEDAVFDSDMEIDASLIAPQITWGTSPEMVVSVSQVIPSLDSYTDSRRRDEAVRALTYMGLQAGTPMTAIRLDRIFIGSCTNSRIGDLREAAQVVRGRHVAPSISQALVVPGSGLVKAQAESEGLDRIFIDAGFEWRSPGCSMCLGMNEDTLAPFERCASTSNRNFEGRQGHQGRTHLVSPRMAAAAAIAGRFVDPLDLLPAC